ncbi:uncharacterized protein [Nicotiana tomentosiformis]|uniref:uncharacterized protein n=1 Tax=Nicotiana tomentosiformis TaxID=4098 RepID=UPI00388C4462
MANNDEIELVSDKPQGQLVDQESEEVRRWKQQLSDVYQAWVSGFKTPKFEKYDRHNDLIAHLKRYYNQLRGAGGKEESLMAYFMELLVGVASEWLIDQDISHWHVWDDMAHAFIKQFQYNIDIAMNRNSLSNMKKKSTESFREHAIKWREKTTRVKPPMDNHELIIIILEAQEPDYFQNMMSAMGRRFVEAIKIGEMVENGLKKG